MNDTRMSIPLGNREFILIGTAHVSRESIDEVSSIIREEKPDLICVELDEGRYASITQKENWESLNMVKVFREGKGFLLMANLVLSGFQRRMGTELGVKPGDEMKIALDIAKELNIPYALCDREVQITLRRAWARCGLWSKSKLLASLFSSAFTTEKLSAREIEDLKNRSELDGMMNELAAYLPRVKETLIDERDRYLAAKIWTSALEQVPSERVPTGQNPAEKSVPRIIAVVGAGHMQGIKAHLEKIAAGEENADVADINGIPQRGIFAKSAGWIIPAIIVALIAVGFFRVGGDLSLAMLLRWVLWNGSLAALGALLALGHPLTILVSFIGAPIASLSPLIGVGFFSGLVQVALRKPRVGDAQTLIDDVGSLKGIYRNRISRALLVFFLSSLGGAIGNFISIPTIAAVLWKS
ncbi:MAG: TraB/GumN family protein [Treponema sp.]|nr:TraB/GumN family protein [Treponema sp.]